MAREPITMRHLREAVEGAAIRAVAIDQVHAEAAARALAAVTPAPVPADSEGTPSHD